MSKAYDWSSWLMLFETVNVWSGFDLLLVCRPNSPFQHDEQLTRKLIQCMQAQSQKNYHVPHFGPSMLNITSYRAQAWVGNYIKTNHQKNLGVSYRIVGLLWLFRQMLLGVYSQQEMSKLWLSNSPPIENASYSFVFLPFLRFTRCVHSWNIRLQNSPLYVKPT